MEIVSKNVLFLLFLSFSSFASDFLDESIIYPVVESVQESGQQISKSMSKISARYSEERKVIYITENELSAMRDLISSQQNKIEALDAKLNSVKVDDGMNFAIWTGILLASVAIILTVLGIVMALFSFFGYKKIKNSVPVLATNTSTVVATSVAEKLAPIVTEKVLVKLLEDGSFDKVINDAVANVTFRGIGYSSGELSEGVVK